MAQNLLQRLFPGEQHHYFGLHEELARSMPRAGRVLDLGCGANRDLAIYRSPEREVWGVDFQPHDELCHREWFRLLASDGTIPFPDASFDTVACIMVLEHVAAPDKFFKEVRRVLRPGGCFVGHTINGSHYVTWIRRLLGLLPHRFNQWLVRKLYGRAEDDTFPTFYRLNRLEQIEAACRQAGLDCVGVRRYADPGYFKFCSPLMAAATTADCLLEKMFPGLGRLYFTFTAKKNNEARDAAKAA